MNVLVAMNNILSVDQLPELRTHDKQVQVAHTKDQFYFRLEQSFEKIAIHCNVFHDVYPWDWMTQLRNCQHKAKVIIALDENIYDSLMLDVIQRMAADFDYTTISIGTSDEEALQEFVSFIIEKNDGHQEEKARRGKVVAVWSASNKDGATTVAINTALALATTSDLSVGLIDGNLKNPEIRANMNLKDWEKSNFNLRPKLQTGALRPDELLSTCLTFRKLQRLHILPGSSRRDTAIDVTPEMITQLIQVARETFDITIIDVNAYPDNAATVCAVRGADIRWLVAQSNYTSFKTSWGEWYQCYWKYCGIELGDISLIVNRSSTDDKPEKIADLLKMNFLANIPNVCGGLGIKSVNEGIPLYLQSQTGAFIDKINGLASILAEEVGSTTTNGAPQVKTRRFSWLAGMF